MGPVVDEMTMLTGPDISEALLIDLADDLDLDIGAEAAARYVEPIRDIVESMEPVVRGSKRAVSVSAVEPRDDEDPYNAFITQSSVKRPETDGSLSGYDVALKDNIPVAGIPLTAGSGMLEGYVPNRNAVVTERLLDAGAHIVGKTNMDEFAFGPTGETSFFGPTKNPRDPDYTPGGSSSGSGAAVATEHADLALGTDTGGSVRIPASYCGVFGYKPTQGLIPTAGVVELAGSLDTVGVLGTSLEDVATCTEVLADDWETPDSFGVTEPDALTVGVPNSLFVDPVRESVAEHVNSVVSDLVSAGVNRMDVTLPPTARSSAVWRAITMSELYLYFYGDALPYRIPGGSNPPFTAAFRGARQADIDRLSDPLKWYLLIGNYLVTRDNGRRYANALAVRDRLTEAVQVSLGTVDVLISPTTPTTAFAFGEFSRDSSPPINNNTHLFNISGHPAISIPCGTIDGLPIGFQVVGKREADVDVLHVAKTVTEIVKDI